MNQSPTVGTVEDDDLIDWANSKDFNNSTSISFVPHPYMMTKSQFASISEALAELIDNSAQVINFIASFFILYIGNHRKYNY